MDFRSAHSSETITMQKIAVSNDLAGFELGKNKIYEIVDRKTVLFLSGGKTPMPLYRKFAKEKIIKPGAVAIVDERWGEPMHRNSNEKMIKDTGFLDYLHSINTPFYSVLKSRKSRNKSAEEYDELVRYLLKWFPKSIAILGLGSDGHIAGIPPRTKNSTHSASSGQEVKSEKFKEKFVEDFDDFPGEQKERITLTFNALSQIDHIFLLVFGNDKKKGLKLLFEDGPIEEVPARFLKTSPISERTLLITDQKI